MKRFLWCLLGLGRCLQFNDTFHSWNVSRWEINTTSWRNADVSIGGGVATLQSRGYLVLLPTLALNCTVVRGRARVLNLTGPNKANSLSINLKSLGQPAVAFPPLTETTFFGQPARYCGSRLHISGTPPPCQLCLPRNTRRFGCG